MTEYASGPSLAEHVKSSGPLGADMVYRLATGLAEALAAIHAAGVVHRDLKPANVLLTQEGPKVIDFGIAQALDGTVMTQTGVTMGSPGFMAPEQVIGKPGQPTDIFTWGLTVAYAASGRPPFGTGPAQALMFRVVHDSPDTSDVPPGLQPLVNVAVSKNPGDRPAARDLRTWLTAEVRTPTGTDAAGHDLGPTQMVLSRTWEPAVTEAPASLPAVRRSRRRTAAIVAGAGVLAAVAGAGVGLRSRTGRALCQEGGYHVADSYLRRRRRPRPAGQLAT